MRELGYDRIWTDKVGNVIGLLHGEDGKSLLFNGHMDIVDPGNPDEWPHPPYSGHLDSEWLWGRGASDMKAALALQIYAPALLRRAGLALPGDCYVTAVVFEETGGLGTRILAGELQADMAVVGEATSNQIARGHRGRLEILVRIKGRSVHASVPERGANPHYSMARFLSKLKTMEMTPSADFGSSSVAPTLYHTDQCSANVVQERPYSTSTGAMYPRKHRRKSSVASRRCSMIASKMAVRGTLRSTSPISGRTPLRRGAAERIPGVRSGSRSPPDSEGAKYTGNPLWTRSAGDQMAVCHRWRVSRQRRHSDHRFAPASDLYPHTTGDRIALEAMVKGLVGYMALALELGRG